MAEAEAKAEDDATTGPDDGQAQGVYVTGVYVTEGSLLLAEAHASLPWLIRVR